MTLQIFARCYLSLTWMVEKCFSLNLSSTYLRTNDVFPTHPSPNSTILKFNWPRFEKWFLDIIKPTDKSANWIGSRLGCSTLNRNYHYEFKCSSAWLQKRHLWEGNFTNFLIECHLRDRSKRKLECATCTYYISEKSWWRLLSSSHCYPRGAQADTKGFYLMLTSFCAFIFLV